MRRVSTFAAFVVATFVVLSLFWMEPIGAWQAEPDPTRPTTRRLVKPLGKNKFRAPVSRRQVHQQIIFFGGGLCSSGVLLPCRPAQAGEIGARINAAVTKSDLGISVRRSVVKGAQIMDGMDGQWEQFSDRFRLGTNRARQADKPRPKDIPPCQPLDGALAAQLLDVSDEVFTSLTRVSTNNLQTQVATVSQTVAPSFERVGLNASDMDVQKPRSGQEFNFLSYCHFKAYTDLILTQQLDYRTFQKNYEEQMGKRIVQLLLPQDSLPSAKPGSLSDPQTRQARWTNMKDCLECLGRALVERGLLAQMDISYDKDNLADWTEDGFGDLQFNVALDGDVTLNAQILLQEQGLRLYPNFARYAVRNLIQTAMGAPTEITDYYMDTDYNSDPDKFQVKEVLLSVVLEND